MSSFESFGLDPRLLSAVTALGFEEPTPIQAEAIPPLLSGRDVIGRARTGSGKTAAYGLPLLQRVAAGGPGLRALVLAPTRELALQVCQDFRRYGQNLGVESVAIYGGASYGPQLAALKDGVPIIVGTPGRVIDHLERGSMDLSALKVLVLDEADEMLRMGFWEEVERVLSSTPAGAQRALFSATMPDPVRRVAQTFLTDPLEIQVEREAFTVDHIEQRYVLVPREHKLEALVRMLRGEPRGTTLVFSRTRSGCAEVAELLSQAGLEVDALHGDMNQGAREHVLRRLRSRRIDVLIATDVAARGIDVGHITHVVNLELPTDIEPYVHRIGRTGRAGRAGVAVNLVTKRELPRLRSLEKALRVQMQEARVPSDADIVRRRRDSLWDELREVPAEAVSAAAERLVAEPTLAAAALALLARERAVEMGPDPADVPPHWARPPERVKPARPAPAPEREEAPRPARKERPKVTREAPERDLADAEGGARPPRAARRADNVPKPRARAGAEAHPGERDMRPVELFFPVGSQRGVRPGDIVGALTNEVGLPPDHVGRVRIFDRKSFVDVPAYAAEIIFDEHPTLALRGQVVPVVRAWPEASRPEGPRRTKGR